MLKSNWNLSKYNDYVTWKYKNKVKVLSTVIVTQSLHNDSIFFCDVKKEKKFWNPHMVESWHFNFIINKERETRATTIESEMKLKNSFFRIIDDVKMTFISQFYNTKKGLKTNEFQMNKFSFSFFKRSHSGCWMNVVESLNKNWR